MDTQAIQTLLDENRRLREQLAQRDRLIEQLQQTIASLAKRLADAERAGKRQAAPFSKGKPQAHPRKPGRKPGAAHGRHGHRQPPAPEAVDETLDAPLPEHCPSCGGTILEDGCDPLYQTEIRRQPLQRQFVIHCGHCTTCGLRVRGRHPLQTSAATGAARCQLGAEAQASIVYLNKQAGLSYGKIADTFDRFFGIAVTAGACAQVVGRAGHFLQPAYQEIREHLQAAEHLTPDETGWRVGGHPAWLHVGVGADGATLYTIDPQRRATVWEPIIGTNWSGRMTHDGFSSYDRFTQAGHQQCVDHVVRRARKMVEQQRGVAQAFPQQVIALFTDSLGLRDQLNGVEASAEERAAWYEAYEEELAQLVSGRRVHPGNARLAKHLGKHAGCWFAFLLHPEVPATNHRAEQALRTPIVNRKVWGGNRTDQGAEAQAVTSSVLETCRNKAVDFIQYVSHAFRGKLTSLFQ